MWHKNTQIKVTSISRTFWKQKHKLIDERRHHKHYYGFIIVRPRRLISRLPPLHDIKNILKNRLSLSVFLAPNIMLKCPVKVLTFLKIVPL